MLVGVFRRDYSGLIVAKNSLPQLSILLPSSGILPRISDITSFVFRGLRWLRRLISSVGMVWNSLR